MGGHLHHLNGVEGAEGVRALSLTGQPGQEGPELLGLSIGGRFDQEAGPECDDVLQGAESGVRPEYGGLEWRDRTSRYNQKAMSHGKSNLSDRTLKKSDSKIATEGPPWSEEEAPSQFGNNWAKGEHHAHTCSTSREDAQTRQKIFTGTMPFATDAKLSPTNPPFPPSTPCWTYLRRIGPNSLGKARVAEKMLCRSNIFMI